MLGERMPYIGFSQTHHPPVPMPIIVIDHTESVTGLFLHYPAPHWSHFFSSSTSLTRCKSRLLSCSISWGMSLLVSWNDDKSGRCPRQDSLGKTWPHLESPWGSLCWMSHGQWPGSRLCRALPLSVVTAIIYGSHHLSQLIFIEPLAACTAVCRITFCSPPPPIPDNPHTVSWGGGRPPAVLSLSY